MGEESFSTVLDPAYLKACRRDAAGAPAMGFFTTGPVAETRVVPERR